MTPCQRCWHFFTFEILHICKGTSSKSYFCLQELLFSFRNSQPTVHLKLKTEIMKNTCLSHNMDLCHHKDNPMAPHYNNLIKSQITGLPASFSITNHINISIWDCIWCSHVHAIFSTLLFQRCSTPQFSY